MESRPKEITKVGSFYTIYLFLNVYLFSRERERERECVCEWARGSEGDTESEAGSRLRAVSTEPHIGLELMNCEIMT